MHLNTNGICQCSSLIEVEGLLLVPPKKENNIIIHHMPLIKYGELNSKRDLLSIECKLKTLYLTRKTLESTSYPNLSTKNVKVEHVIMNLSI